MLRITLQSISYTSLFDPCFSATLIVLSLVNVGTILGRRIIPNPINENYYMCVLRSQPLLTWKMMDKTLNSTYVQKGIPLLLHLISTLSSFVISLVAKLTSPVPQVQTWLSVFFKQLPSHKDFLIPPVVIFLCTIGHIILLQMKSNHCLESDMKFYLRFHLVLDMLIYLPQVLTYLIYIHPSEVYRPKSYDTLTYKIICWIKPNLFLL